IGRLGMRSVSMSGRSVLGPSGSRMILLSIEDVTERLLAEAERTRLLDDARAARAAAEDANRTKDSFLAMLSHELRTPLSTMLLQAQLLRRGNLDAARLQWTAESIERAVKTQAQLV